MLEGYGLEMDLQFQSYIKSVWLTIQITHFDRPLDGWERSGVLYNADLKRELKGSLNGIILNSSSPHYVLAEPLMGDGTEPGWEPTTQRGRSYTLFPVSLQREMH